jgi:tRNA-modifying protein YgfZ
MNITWKTFLLNQQTLANDENRVASADTTNFSENSIYPLTHLAVLSVTGKDAAKLLQGQITCNVDDISETKSSLAAMCNPKGRAIATFLLVKKADVFLLVLPEELLETVKKRLQLYVLRSDAKITDCSDEFFLLGLCEPESAAPAFTTLVQKDVVSVNLPGLMARKLLITDVDNDTHLWSDRIDSKGFRKASPDEWLYLDILSGIPWVTAATSEEFIPQMLNLDKLGGISFNKGCYTGQEIVARTHYLGKSKREMFLAECQTLTLPEPNSSIVNKDSAEQEVAGKVLLAQLDGQSCKMLLVLQTTDSGYNNLGLQNDRQAQIKITPFAYD